MTSPRSVVAIGGSAGGIEALVQLVASLPADLPAPVLVTVHVGNRARSSLPEILSRAGLLDASHARHGEPLRPGRIYVAPPDVHLLVGAGVVRLSSGPRVNRYRPAVDVMFAGVARWAGSGAVAVVLSGLLDDGAVGAALVARAGGHVVVQNPHDAIFDSMPRAALSAVPAARVVSTVQLGKAVGERLELSTATDDDRERVQEMSETSMSDSDDPGYLTADEARLTRMSCPDCNGGLAEIELSDVRYYRCHVGHQYGPRSLEAAQREAAEAKLWAAAAALEEHAALARHLARDPRTTDSADYRRAAERSADAAKALLSRMDRAGTQPA